MNASQFPGQTLAPIPANSSYAGDDEFSNIQKINQLLFNIVAGGGGGGTLAGDVIGPSGSNTVAKIQGVAISGTPKTGDSLVASSPTAAAWTPPINALPSWMFDAADLSDPDPGCFTTDNTSIFDTTQLRISSTMLKGGDYAGLFTYLVSPAAPGYLIMTNSLGVSAIIEYQVAVNAGSGTTITVLGAPPSVGTWSGIYQISVFPRIIDITLAALMATANPPITPCPDGTVNPVTSITTVGGIITTIS